jgi:hypothetical protein
VVRFAGHSSFISAFGYEGDDIPMLARRLRTREWWELERRHFSWRAALFLVAKRRDILHHGQ